MVEPNYTDKERYSISFNMEMNDMLVGEVEVFKPWSRLFF